MCGGCGRKSTAVRVARNVPKNKLKTMTNRVIVVRHEAGKKSKVKRFKPSTPTGGVRVVRSGR